MILDSSSLPANYHSFLCILHLLSCQSHGLKQRLRLWQLIPLLMHFRDLLDRGGGDGLLCTFNKSHLLVSTVSFSKLGVAASSLSHLHIFWPLLFPVMSSPEGHCSGTFPNLWDNLQSLLETPLTKAVFQAVVGRKLSFPFNYRYTLICG